jgi:endonuclease G
MASGKAARAALFLRNAQTGGVQNEETVFESLDAATATTPPVTNFDALHDDDKAAVEGALAKIDTPEAMEPQEEYALEAIIIPDRRPAVDIRNDDYRVDHVDWLHLNDAAARATILPRIPAIGRIEIPEHPSLPYAGTGFLVGDGLLMTNRHVAELLVRGLGRNGLSFRPGYTGEINFVEEAGRSGGVQYRIDAALLIHPYWDMAILRVRDVPREVQPLTLSRQAAAADGPAPDVVVIGYPAFDPRNDIEVQRQVFGNLFNVKRLQPGKWLERRRVGSFGKQVEAMTHDSSTLGGNSGSAVIDVASGRAVALHFGGRYLDANYGVPTGDLALDARLVDLGLNFADGSGGAPTDGPWVPFWQQTEQESAAPNAGRPPPGGGGGAAAGATLQATASAASWTIPLTISVGQPVPAAAAMRRPATATAGAGDGDISGEEAPVEDYRGRGGYAPDFLGPDVPLPRVVRGAVDVLDFDGDGGRETELRYEHYSVVMSRSRRMCYFSAVNISGGQSRKSKRVGWKWDPRLPREQQIMNECYGAPPRFSRGHMTRREDPGWGDEPTAKRGNQDSMHVTNATPQMQAFNAPIWLALEDYALDHARGDAMDISVFTGPYFDIADPTMYGVRIPLAFWKIIAFIHDETNELCATGYEMNQQGQLQPEEFVFGQFVSPQLAIATQVPIRAIGARGGLDFGSLADFDPLGSSEEAIAAVPAPLNALSQIRFR